MTSSSSISAQVQAKFEKPSPKSALTSAAPSASASTSAPASAPSKTTRSRSKSPQKKGEAGSSRSRSRSKSPPDQQKQEGCSLFPQFLKPQEAEKVYKECSATATKYVQDHGHHKIMGHLEPRLVGFVGNAQELPGHIYEYARTKKKMEPWSPLVADIAERITAHTGHKFNVCLVNYYRNGQDSVSWHEDKDAFDTAVASVSCYAKDNQERRFDVRDNESRAITNMQLGQGSLLIMHPGMQRTMQHRVPKEDGVKFGRVNLTFRYHAPSPLNISAPVVPPPIAPSSSATKKPEALETKAPHSKTQAAAAETKAPPPRGPRCAYRRHGHGCRQRGSASSTSSSFSWWVCPHHSSKTWYCWACHQDFAWTVEHRVCGLSGNRIQNRCVEGSTECAKTRAKQIEALPPLKTPLGPHQFDSRLVVGPRKDDNFESSSSEEDI